MNLAKGIKILLVRRGITQKELAEIINLSETSVSLILKDKTQPRKNTLDAIVKALDTKLEVLYLLSIDKNDCPEDKRQYFDILWPTVETTIINLFTSNK